MYQAGDTVFVERSAIIDIGFRSWSFVEARPKATITKRMEAGAECPESEVVYAVQWPVEFSGGWDCYGHCERGKGQFVTAKHLSLCFEESREVTTVPAIKGYDETQTGTTKKESR